MVTLLPPSLASSQPTTERSSTSMLWRMTIISMGAIILTIGVWLWVSDAVEEYRNLPDE